MGMFCMNGEKESNMLIEQPDGNRNMGVNSGRKIWSIL